jgi:hypothetical protein
MAKGLKLPKVLTLDYQNWRCGRQAGRVGKTHGKACNKKSLGTSLTLLQAQGYTKNHQCCLGQFALQAGMTEDDIVGHGLPSDVEGLAFGSQFCNRAITINDDTNTTIVEKIRKIRRLCGKYHRTLTLKNFPKSVMDALASA